MLSLTEQQEIFASRHEKIVSKISKIYKDCDTDYLNLHIGLSKLTIAGGYARRLFMMVNDIPMCQEDWDAYISKSDVDLYIGGFRREQEYAIKDKKSLRDNNPFSLLAGIGLTSSEKFKNSPLVKTTYRLPSVDHRKSQTLTVTTTSKETEFLTQIDDNILCYSMDNAHRILETVDDDIKLQLIFVDLKAVSMLKNIDDIDRWVEPVVAMQKAYRIVRSFDIDCSMYLVSELNSDYKKCNVLNLGHTYSDDFYVCAPNAAVCGAKNISRLMKYGSYGFKYDLDAVVDFLENGDILANNLDHITCGEYGGGY